MFYCLLFIHVNMCVYIMYIFIESPYCYYYVDIESGFRVSAGLVLGRGYYPNRFGVRFGFEFRFRVRVHIDFARSEPAPLPSLVGLWRLVVVDPRHLAFGIPFCPPQSHIGLASFSWPEFCSPFFPYTISLLVIPLLAAAPHCQQ